MSDNSIINIGKNSQEHVAYKLLELISLAEGKSINGGLGVINYDRKWILDSYAECIDVVRNGVAARS